MDRAAKHVCRALSLNQAETKAADEISQALEAAAPPERSRKLDKRNKGLLECPSSDS